MSTIGRFISPAKIKDEAYVDENVDDKYLSDSILLCQELYIKTVLGTALYNEVQDEIEAGSVSSDNTTLLRDYIQPALKWWVLYEAMDMLNVKITNKAVVKKRSENSEPVPLNEILHLKNKFRDHAEWYTNRLKKYLIANATSTKFNNFLNPGSAADTIFPKKDVFSTGWYLGGSTNTYGLDVDKGDNCCD